MKDLRNENTDLVSLILDDKDLLNTFADSLQILETNESSQRSHEDLIPANNKGERIRYFVWKKIKEILSFVSTKIQTLAVLAEYNFKNLEKKIQSSMDKKLRQEKYND